MTWDRDGFRSYFQFKIGAAPNTVNTYSSFLNRIDELVGGLDEKIAAQGVEAVLNWSKTANGGPFETYPSSARSVVKRYIQFRIDEPDLDETVEDDILSAEIEQDSNFKVEREMQAQVRKQLNQIEAGLAVEDGGGELITATGKIDIVARDRNGALVVIELKAGKCPAGGLEQVLAYAQSLSEERGEPTRAVLIAGSFPDRIRAAAKRAGNVELKTYAYTLNFLDQS